MTDFDRAYRENAELVYRYVFSLTRNADLAEEVTQQTFYEAIDLPALVLRPAKYHLCRTIVWKNVSHGTLRKKSKPKLPESEVIL